MASCGVVLNAARPRYRIARALRRAQCTSIVYGVAILVVLLLFGREERV
jgi:hypothetical protein